MLKLPWPFAPPTTPSPTSGYFSWHQLSSVVSLTLVLQQSLRLSGLTVLQEDPGGGPYSCGMAGRGGGGAAVSS